MAIARRRTNKKNNIRRKSRSLVKRGGARKMTQKGGSAAPLSCDGLATVKVEINNGQMDEDNPVLTVCVDPQILQGIGQGLAQGGILGLHEGSDVSWGNLYNWFIKIRKTVFIKQYQELQKLLNLVNKFYSTNYKINIYIMVGQVGQNLYLQDDHQNKHECPLLPNALSGEILSLYTDAGGVTYLHDDFERQIAPYLKQIKISGNVGILQQCARDFFGFAGEKGEAFLSQMYTQARGKLSKFWNGVTGGDRELQIEAAKLAMTVAGMVYGGTIGTAISTAVGLSTQAASLFFSSAVSLGLTGLSALLTGVGLAITTYGACIYLMFGLSIVPNLFLTAALYSFKVRYPDATPERFPEYLGKVLEIVGITKEYKRFMKRANTAQFSKRFRYIKNNGWV